MPSTTKRSVSRAAVAKVGDAAAAGKKISKSTKGGARAISVVEGEKAEIIARVTEWAGGPLQALAWYREVKIPSLGQRTAETLVKEGHAAAVRAYLDHIAVGGFA